MRSVPVFQAVAGFSPFFADCPPFLRAPLFFHFFFPAIFRYRHALQCAKAMILAAQAPAISPHSFLFRNRSVDGRFSSAIRANHCFFLLLRPTSLRVVGFASAERQSRCPQRSFRFAQPSLRPTPALRAVVGFGAALPRWGVLTARCFAPFFSAFPLTFGDAQTSPLRCPV